MPNSTCSVAECDEATAARGWCRRHYNRWHHSGDPTPWLPTPRECAQCGDDFTQSTPGKLSLYCSKECGGRASYLRRKAAGTLPTRPSQREGVRLPCGECGTQFDAKRPTVDRFCSKPCARRYYRKNETRPCAVDGCSRTLRAKGFCNRHYIARFNVGDPEKRRAGLRRSTQRRRALLRDPNAERIDRDEVGARDGWRCGLCSRLVDNSLPHPDPQSASLDHIEPLSLGGLHTMTNVQIAHLVCNLAKGNRVTDVQPLLVG